MRTGDDYCPAVKERLLLVPNDTLRERFLELQQCGEMTATKLATRMGWMMTSKGRTRGDGSRVQRSLGLRSNVEGNGGNRTPRIREAVGYDTAVRFADALGMDPHEAEV